MIVSEVLTVLDYLPDGLLELGVEELHTKLSGPTLIHLQGARNPPVFISVLLHGNEHTSWEAVRKLLSHYCGRELPRSVSLFIGNIAAARKNQRFLPGEFDFNRLWGASSQAAHPMMQQIIDDMRKRGAFLSVDIHNNTGKNPHYACVNRVEKDFLYLASLFSRSVVFFLKPEGVQSMAFAELCPAVTIECGLSGEESGTLHAFEFLQACLHLSEFPQKELSAGDLSVYHTVAIAKINPAYDFGFDDIQQRMANQDIILDSQLEKTNFSPLAAGSVLGWVRNNIANPISVMAEDGSDVSANYIVVNDGVISIKSRIIPAMLTLDVSTIKKDCLCYFMEEYPLWTGR